ncbi:uncharacterized protein LOC119068249 [Bradysia coprophila]|uniref:uncharacterized protein LOC119068249 n=1 Tax=Bradysia coprophila TaxID=38358 RepID=UPI00187DB16A|nr:uncharacterized protein LOC119068249 [Bradysia coprophila]
MDAVQETTNRIDDGATVSSNLNQRNVVTELSLAELPNSTRTKLYDLNDDCLLEIFSSNSLSQEDLCSLAETCRRFKKLTQLVFSKEFDIKGLRFDFQSRNMIRDDETTTYRILKNFGSGLTTLSICGVGPVVNSVSKYCEAGTLKRLEFRSINVADSFAVALKPIFQKLHTLHITYAPIECSENVFVNCDSLTELEITSTPNCSAILKNTFPNLKRFSIGRSERFQDYFSLADLDEFTNSDTLFTFIGRHGCLKVLTLNAGCVYRNCNFTDVIGKSCTGLEELTLRNFYSYDSPSKFTQLQGLTKLRMLDIDVRLINPKQFKSILTALKSLETVKLSRMCMFDVGIVHVLPSLSKLKNLRELHLIKCRRGIAIASNHPISWTMLSQLKKIHITESNSVSRYSTAEILNQLTNLEELVVDNVRIK